MTKEEVVRKELQSGKEEGLLADLHRAFPFISISRMEAVASGGEVGPGEVDVFFDALGLDEDSLEDEPDPEAPSERDGVRSWVVEYVNGVEGPSLSLGMTPRSSGRRIAGPKPWGGGTVVRTWRIDPAAIFEALGYTRPESEALARAVEGFRKINEAKYPALYPTS